MRALDAGKHVVCEKPMAMDAAEARRMAARARERGLLLMEAFMYRFHPQWRRARDIIATGEIGEVRAVHGWFSYNNADPKNIRNSTDTGGGGLYDIGCYAVSSARWLVGEEPSRALALVERDPEFRTDRLSSGILDFPRGAPLDLHPSPPAPSRCSASRFSAPAARSRFPSPSTPTPTAPWSSR